MLIKFIAGPLIGALIGYCTNYIAVKMLFRPRKPIAIGGKTLPFTPGIIPKRKNDLARALGKAVSRNLLTSGDLAESMSSDKVKKRVSDEVWEFYEKLTEEDRSVKELAEACMTAEHYEQTREHLEDKLTEKILEGLLSADLGEIIAREGSAAVKEMAQGSVLSMMLNDQVIQSIAKPIGERVQTYLEEHGEERIRPIIAKQAEKFEEERAGGIIAGFPAEKSSIEQMIAGFYESGMKDKLGDVLSDIDVAGIVERKVREMDTESLEELIMSVMKNELNAIVNLGAAIGLIIGLLNLAVAAF